MTKETNPISQLSTGQLIQQRDKTIQTIEKRGFHIGQIGHCKIEDGSSFENSLELGLRRADAKGRLAQDQEKLNDINQELVAYDQAKQYLDKIELRKKQLTQMNQLVTQGNLSPEILKKHQNEYQEFALLSETDPVLIRGIARIRLEEEKKEELQESKPTKDNKLSRKSAQLLALLEDSSPDVLVTSDQITQSLWPETDNNTARKRLGVLVSKTKGTLQGTCLDLIVISDPSKKIKGEKARYYLKKTDLSNQISELTQSKEAPKIPNYRDTDNIPQISDDEEIASINKPEYGTLSRVDICIIAGAICSCSHILKPIFNESGVRIIEEQTLSELFNITGEISLADSKRITEKQYIDSLSKLRTEALQKAKDLIESPEIDKILDQTYAQNPEVWCLLANLYEMNNKLKGEGKNENNYYNIKKGIAFLTDLVTNPNEIKWIYYITDNQGNKSRRCYNCAGKTPDIVCSGKY